MAPIEIIICILHLESLNQRSSLLNMGTMENPILVLYNTWDKKKLIAANTTAGTRRVLGLLDEVILIKPADQYKKRFLPERLTYKK